MHDLEPLRVALIAGDTPVFLELERTFLAQPDVQLVRFVQPEPFFGLLEDDALLGPNLVVLEDDDALSTLERIRRATRGALLPVVMLRATWTKAQLELAWMLGANSCLTWPEDTLERQAFWDELTAYWCQTNEPNPV